MRIDQQIPTSEPAARAPDAQRDARAGEASFSGLHALIAIMGNSGGDASKAGPMGIADTARLEMTDPLGLATQQASSSPASSPLTDGRFQADAEVGQAPGTRGSAGQDAREGSGRDQAGRPAQGDSDSLRPSLRGKPSRFDPPDGANRQVESRANGADRAQHPGTTTHATTAGAGRSVRGGTPAIGASAGATAPVQPAGAGAQSTGTAIAGIGLERASRSSFRAASLAQPGQPLRSEQAEIAPQVAKGLAALVLKDGGSAQIQLRPEALGRVDVDLTVRDGAVRATMSAENESARDLLVSELDRLRSLLEQRGLRVESLEVLSADDEQDALANAGDRRGGRWMSAQDEPHGSGTDAGQDSPGEGGQHDRARGGAPLALAERGGPGNGTESAEAEDVRSPSGTDAIARGNPGVRLIRLDTVV